MLDDATLAGYIDELSVTGLTSNPTIFDKAIAACDAYDDQIAEVGSDAARSDEEVFFDLAIDDLRRAADEFAEVHERTAHLDGFVSLEVSPELAFDTAGARSRRRASSATADGAPERLHQDPGHAGGPAGDRRGDPRGHPGQRHAAVLQRAAPRRRRRVDDAASSAAIADGLPPDVPSVASLFMSRWDVKANPNVPGGAAGPARRWRSAAAPTSAYLRAARLAAHAAR